MTIYTSYFGKVKQLIENDIVPVAISVKKPFYFKGLAYKPLQPPWDLVKNAKDGKITREDYDAIYNQQLKQLKVENVIADLKAISKGKDVAILCYEKNVIDCHRNNVAEWLNQNSNEKVTEFKTKEKVKIKQGTLLL